MTIIFFIGVSIVSAQDSGENDTKGEGVVFNSQESIEEEQEVNAGLEGKVFAQDEDTPPPPPANLTIISVGQ